MKSQSFLLLFVATLSCSAQNSTANSANRPAQTAEVAKPAQGTGAAATPAKAAEPVAPAQPATEASQKPAVQESAAPSSTMAAVVVKVSRDTAHDFRKDMEEMRAEQQAAMAQHLADSAQGNKAGFAGMFAIEQPKMSLSGLSNGAAPVAALTPPVSEGKSLPPAARK